MLAGMDASGDCESGNNKFMAIVIGTDERVDAMARRLGPRPIHMRRINGRDAKNAIVDKAEFDRQNLMGICLRLEKRRTFSRLQKRSQHSFKNKKKMSRTYNALLWRLLRDPVEQFLQLHGCGAHQLVFQCDYDCRDFVNDRGWRRADPGPAHELADVLAWGNSHRREPRGVVHLDLSDSLEEQMLDRFG